MIHVSLRNDIFGCDLVARKLFVKEWKDDYEQYRIETTKEIWIQATMGTNVGRKLQEIANHVFMRGNEVETHIWLRTDIGETNIKKIQHIKGLPTPGELQISDIGKILRAKFYSAEGIDYEF